MGMTEKALDLKHLGYSLLDFACKEKMLFPRMRLLLEASDEIGADVKHESKNAMIVTGNKEKEESTSLGIVLCPNTYKSNMTIVTVLDK